MLLIGVGSKSFSGILSSKIRLKNFRSKSRSCGLKEPNQKIETHYFYSPQNTMNWSELSLQKRYRFSQHNNY